MNVDTNPTSSAVEKPPSRWRYYGGWFFFILCWLLPFASPLVSMLGFSKTTTAMIIGGLILGGPELCGLIAIALWGKTTFNYFMARLYRVLKRLGPPGTVSVGRYYVGLFLFMSSFIPSWIIAYAPTLVNDKLRVYIVLSFDILFVMSFFVLGGDFWEKIRALFIPGPIVIMKQQKNDSE